MSDFLYIKIEAISGKNEIGLYHLDIPYGEELEHDTDEILGKIQKVSYPYTCGTTYRISYATTVKGLTTSAGIIYAKLITTADVSEDMLGIFSWEQTAENFNYDTDGVFAWQVIVCKDYSDDFQMF